MASSIVHLAVIKELAGSYRFTDESRLKFGVILPDGGIGTGSHLKIKISDTQKHTYNLDRYRAKFGERMKKDDLYLGYYLHLVQDLCFRHFVYDTHHWDPMPPGNVERLHKDYAIVNHYVVEKYGLVNDLMVPEGFACEEINTLCEFDLEEHMESIRTYFEKVEDGEIFFFTKEMTDEYIVEAAATCAKELEALQNGGRLIDAYENAWSR